MREFLKSAVGLTAIGTVADVVPLLGENRVLVRYGLGSLSELATPGMSALMKCRAIPELPPGNELPDAAGRSDSRLEGKRGGRGNAWKPGSEICKAPNAEVTSDPRPIAAATTGST